MTNEEKTRALRGALAALKKGLKIIPISEEAITASGNWMKKPRIPKWQFRATSDPAQVHAWFDGNYGEAAGEMSRRWNDTAPCSCFGATLEGLIAFDVDSPSAMGSLRSIFREAGFDDIVPTLSTKSGRGGSHWIYRVPEGFSLGQSAGVLADRLDTRGGASSQIVLPGTMNPVTGGLYEVLMDVPIAELPVSVAKAVQPKLRKARTLDEIKTRSADRRQGSVPDTPNKVNQFVKYLVDKDGGVEGAGGEADLLEVSMIAADLGLSQEKAFELAFAIYNPKCSPVWEEDEFRTKISNGYRYRENEIGCCDPDLSMGMLDSEDRGYGSIEPGDEEAFPLESMMKFRDTEPEPVEYLIDGFMAHGAFLSFIYGRGGSGKSLLVLQMLQELMLKKPFLGMNPGGACERLKPLLLSCEEPRNALHLRYWKQNSKIDPDKKGQGPVLCDLRGRNHALFRKERNGLIKTTPMFDSLVRVVKSGGFNLLVIDNLARIFPGNEIDRAEVTAFSNAIDELCMETGCHVIVIAHMNKGNSFSGCTAWEAICRQMLFIESEKLGNDRVYKLTVEKTNVGSRGVSVKYVYDDMYFRPVSNEEIEAKREAIRREIEDSKREASESAIGSILNDMTGVLTGNDGEMTSTILMQELKAYGYKRPMILDAIEAGVQSGILRKTRGKRSATGSYPTLVSLAE